MMCNEYGYDTFLFFLGVLSGLLGIGLDLLTLQRIISFA
jgi:hypothetical protein